MKNTIVWKYLLRPIWMSICSTILVCSTIIGVLVREFIVDLPLKKIILKHLIHVFISIVFFSIFANGYQHNVSKILFKQCSSSHKCLVYYTVIKKCIISRIFCSVFFFSTNPSQHTSQIAVCFHIMKHFFFFIFANLT
jgi:hypothetical protein